MNAQFHSSGLQLHLQFIYILVVGSSGRQTWIPVCAFWFLSVHVSSSLLLISPTLCPTCFFLTALMLTFGNFRSSIRWRVNSLRRFLCHHSQLYRMPIHNHLFHITVPKSWMIQTPRSGMPLQNCPYMTRRPGFLFYPMSDIGNGPPYRKGAVNSQAFLEK